MPAFNDRVNATVTVAGGILRAHSKDALILLTGFGMPAFVALISGSIDATTFITATFSLFAAIAAVLIRNGQTGLARIAKFILEVATAVGVPTVVALVTGQITSALIGAGLLKLLGAIAVYESVDASSISNVQSTVNDGLSSLGALDNPDVDTNAATDQGEPDPADLMTDTVEVSN